jgi:hypothetical protein
MHRSKERLIHSRQQSLKLGVPLWTSVSKYRELINAVVCVAGLHRSDGFLFDGGFGRSQLFGNVPLIEREIGERTDGNR